MLNHYTKERRIRDIPAQDHIKEQVYSVLYPYMLNKALEKGINVCESYPFQTSNSSQFPSVLVLLNGMDDMFIGLNESSSIREKVKSLACCFVFFRTPGSWKKTFKVNEDVYCWLESNEGRRDSGIDEKASRYISFLAYKVQQQHDNTNNRTFKDTYSQTTDKAFSIG